MNSEIENRLLQMFIKISEEMKFDRGSSSEIEMIKDETTLNTTYKQEFFFGKNNEEYKYLAYVMTNLNNLIIEEKYEEA